MRRIRPRQHVVRVVGGNAGGSRGRVGSTAARVALPDSGIVRRLVVLAEFASIAEHVSAKALDQV
jgi:hypothetical protein